MAFLSPIALALFGLAGAVLALHLLGRRSPRVAVPSAMFWRDLSRPIGGLARGRRRLASLLLLLDLIAVALLSLALARPSFEGGVARNLIILVDASASMQSVDVSPSRFDEARRQAVDLVSGLRQGDGATVVRVGTTAGLVGSTLDGRALPSLVAEMQPGNGPADWATAAALVTARLEPARRNEVIVLSDGSGRGAIPASLVAEVEYRQIGRSSDNQAITALALRAPAEPDRPATLFARVANYADRPVDVPIRALADGATFESRLVELPARGIVDLDLDAPTGARLVELHLERGDLLSLDNRAVVVARGAVPLEVVLVSDVPLFLERVLRLLPGVRLQVVAPDAYSPDAPADVVVLDRFLPDQLPAGNLLLVDPPVAEADAPLADPSSLGLESLGEVSYPLITAIASGDPLLDGVDLAGLEVQRAHRLRVPGWAREVVGSEDGPLLSRGLAGSRRVVVAAFDFAQTDLPYRPAFPSLVANSLDWLRPLAVPAMARPDSVVEVQVPAGWQGLAASGPQGAIPLLRPSGAGQAFVPVSELGVHQVFARAPSGRVVEVPFGVSLLDEGESDVAPRPDLPTPASGPPSSVRARAEVWPMLALAVCLVLLVEWWWYHRGRGRVGGRRRLRA